MSKLFYFLSICLICFAASCNSVSEEDQKLLKEAAEVHQKAVDIEQQVTPKLDALVQQKNQINIQGRALTTEETEFVKKVESLESSYAYWQENHVEVPGFEHSHGHEEHAGHDHDGEDHDHDHAGHDHDHGHGATLEVSASDMLIIQKEFMDSILSIQQRVEKLRIPEGPKLD